MSKQARYGAPKLTRGAKRLFICEEAFDCKVGAMGVAVIHPVSQISFAVNLPDGWRNGDDKMLTLKKSIWAKYQDLRQIAASKQQLSFEQRPA